MMTEFERLARDLLDNYDSDRSPVCLVFRAMWATPLTAERVKRIADAMTDSDTGDLTKELRRAVRAKVLHVQRIGKTRFYAVNLSRHDHARLLSEAAQDATAKRTSKRGARKCAA